MRSLLILLAACLPPPDAGHGPGNPAPDSGGESGTLTPDDAMVRIVGDGSQMLGTELLWLPDLDGDMLPELAVAAVALDPVNPMEQFGAGKVYIFGSEQVLGDANGAIGVAEAGLVLTSDEFGTGFGYAMLQAEIGSPQEPYFLISEPGRAVREWSGAVWALTTGDLKDLWSAGGIQTMDGGKARWITPSDDTSDQGFGLSIAVADLEPEQAPHLVISGTTHNAAKDGACKSGGYAYGVSSDEITGTGRLSTRSSQLIFDLTGDDCYEGLYLAGRVLGHDLDADNSRELIGAALGGLSLFAVYGPLGDLGINIYTSLNLGGSPHAMAAFDWGGGDRLAVGYPTYAPDTVRGRVMVIGEEERLSSGDEGLSPESHCTTHVQGEDELGYFGHAVAGVDTDGSAEWELAVGAPLEDGARGVVRVFDLDEGSDCPDSSEGEVLRISGEYEDDYLGFALLGGHHDLSDVLVVSAPYGEKYDGGVYVFRLGQH